MYEGEGGNFGLWHLERGGGWTIQGCPKGGRGEFSISSMGGGVWIFSGTTHWYSDTVNYTWGEKQEKMLEIQKKKLVMEEKRIEAVTTTNDDSTTTANGNLSS
jgi:hypothetical protein